MTEQHWAIVTGGGTGIGRALAAELAGHGVNVLIVGRRAEQLEQTRALDDRHIQAVAADVTEEDGRRRVQDALPGSASVSYLVHNAGLLDPIGPIGELDPQAWRRNMAVNLEAPLFLTQGLLGRMNHGRILHVSSGAAHRPIAGWSAYCTAKAGLFMLYRCINAELNERRILCASLRPGVVDTPMQAHIREQSEERFPSVERFRSLQRDGRLHPPQEVARFMSWVLREVSDGAFPAREWDIDDTTHHELWGGPSA